VREGWSYGDRESNVEQEGTWTLRLGVRPALEVVGNYESHVILHFLFPNKASFRLLELWLLDLLFDECRCSPRPPIGNDILLYI